MKQLILVTTILLATIFTGCSFHEEATVIGNGRSELKREWEADNATCWIRLEDGTVEMAQYLDGQEPKAKVGERVLAQRQFGSPTLIVHIISDTVQTDSTKNNLEK